MKKRYLFIVLFFLFLEGFAQKTIKDPLNLYSFSPETSALMKYSEVPVSNYTGIPNITIPVYTIKMQDYELPIYLSYHAGGVLVGDIAAPVGLGWSLVTVNPITRQINGYVDEKGFMKVNSVQQYLDDSQGSDLQIAFSDCSQTVRNVMNPTNIAKADLTADDFNYSLPQSSGSFRYNQDTSQFVFFPITNTKLQYAITNPQSNLTSDGGINTFTLTEGNGVKYEFGGTNAREYNHINDRSIYYYGTVAWKIKKITPPSGNEINFEYTTNSFIRDFEPINTVFSATNFVNYYNPFDDGCNPNSNDAIIEFYSLLEPGGLNANSPSQYNGTQSNLQEINFPDGKIVFSYSSRIDDDYQKKLDFVTVYDKNNQIVSVKKFTYDYFNTPYMSSTDTKYTKRLKLIGYEECDVNEECLATSFEYYEYSNLPSIKSHADDYWGYFNNSDTSNKTIPKSAVKRYDFINGIYKWDLSTSLLNFSDEKNVNPNYVNAFSLRSISYPNDAKNEFIYEPNLVSEIYDEQYLREGDCYFDAKAYPNMVKQYDGFNASGYFYDGDMYSGITPTSQSTYSKTYIKQFDFSDYDKDFELKIGITSNFRAANFNVSETELFGSISIYYYEQGVKKYLLQNFMPSSNSQEIFNYFKYNNQNFPDIAFVEIKHTYYGGINASYSIPYYTYVSFEWDEKIPNTTNENFYAGGLRIKEIKTYDGDTYLYSSKYSYTEENSTTSSGLLFNVPIYKEDYRLGSFTVGNVPCPGPTGSITPNNSYYTNYNLIKFSSSSVVSGMTTNGRSAGYKRVEVKRTDKFGTSKGKEVFTYRIEPSPQTGDNYLLMLEGGTSKYNFLENRDWRNGLLLTHNVFDSNNFLVKKTENEYDDFFDDNTSFFINNTSKSILYNTFPKASIDLNASPFEGFLPYDNSGWYNFDHLYGSNFNYTDVLSLGVLKSHINLLTYIPTFTYHSDIFLLKKKTITEYFGTEELKTEYVYDYDNIDHLQPTELSTISSEQQPLKTNYSYAPDLGNQAMIDKNMTGIPLKTEIFRDNEKLSTEETTYKDWGSGLVAPEFVKTSKGQDNLEVRAKYNILDAKGNPLEVQQESGMVVTYLWGYNQTRPIAKIENATYSQVLPYESNLQTLSNGTDENALRAALNSLRTALPNAMITTYTYKPLVGVSTITDPKGNKTTYHYDSFNRLQYVKDKDGNILSENEYHYRTQN